MNIFESMAHALIGEHGRQLFRRDHTSSSTYGYGTKFWRIALLCYGKDFYMLPKRLGLSVKNPEAKDANSKFAFPAFTTKCTALLGIPLTEMFLYPSIGGYQHQYTPLHLSIGLRRFGPPSVQAEADELMQLDFMKKLWPTGRKPEDFASQTMVCPYRPEDFGLKPYDLRALFQDDGTEFIVDELGNAAWFPEEYVTNILDRVSVELWYNSAYKLARCSTSFHALRERASKKQLYVTALGKRDTYEKLAKYIRHTTKSSAAAFVGRHDIGVAVVAGAFRADANTETMVRALRTLGTAKSEVLEASYRYIGRPLTYDDFKPLTPGCALTILRNVHFDLVKDVITERSQDLSALFFKLPNDQLKDVMDCMSPREGYGAQNIGGRQKWYPDTPEGNDALFNLSQMTKTEFDIKAEWDDYMKPLITQHVETREWRKELLDIADPDAAFLAVTRYTAKPDDPVPHDALDNVLRSHPNASMLIEHVQRHPLFTESYAAL